MIHSTRRRRRRARRLRRRLSRRRSRAERRAHRSGSESRAASASIAAASRRRRCCTSPRSIDESRHAKAWGVEFGEPKIDLDKLRAFKDNVVKRLTSGTGQLVKLPQGASTSRACAEILDPHNLDVKLTAGGEDRLQFEHAILATGSVPAIPPMLKVDDPRVMDSTAALDLPDIPKSLLVVGGGYIGLELGSVYATLGSAVTVVEMTPGLLPGADRDLVDVLAKRVDADDEERAARTRKVVADEAGGQGHPRHVRRRRPDGQKEQAVRPRAGRRSAGGRTRRFPASRTTRVQGRTSAASSWSTSSCAPTSRRSSRSATSSASRCWRTRRRTKGASRSK